MLDCTPEAHQRLIEVRKHAQLLDSCIIDKAIEEAQNGNSRYYQYFEPGISVKLERALTSLHDFRCVFNSDVDNYQYDVRNAVVQLRTDSYSPYDFYWSCWDKRHDMAIDPPLVVGGLNYHGPTREELLGTTNPFELIESYHGWSINT